MSEQHFGTQEKSPKPFQFTIRSLLWLTTACALLLGMVKWLGWGGLLLYLFALGLYWVVRGLYRRELWLVIYGAYVLFALSYLLFFWSLSAW